MTHPLSPLSTSDRVLLRLMVRFVPIDEREDWLRCWRAELWHRRYPRARVSKSAVDLYPGLVSDAMWLRAESWRQAFTGTASLCIASLVVALLFAMLPLLVFFGGVHGLGVFVAANTNLFLCEAALVALVSFATSSRVVEHASPAAPFSRLRTQMFLAAKLVLVLLITFLLSEDLARTFYGVHPFTAEILQPQFFVVMALLGQRWNFSDQDSRCKHCLRVLALPARVGRPSWNFLDSNGTEFVCKDGHGLLSVPEIETSWRPSSRWIAA
ncbi:hypothetical protein GCM10011507_30330 [Edaphobacter acidisoli]|uniref:Uncharacterized protein n=1 Tax=Edaphobacter acidisoli TaxID=2040573 RepID=A0A916W8V8_9BACT|nr:hypothetical protein [Edaphobacter acidisoli]GGA76929.1 hypothetical protein GCM10011507_30330 [Edaphobacter acidisoli]